MDVTNPSMTKPINKWTIAGVDHVLSLKNVSFLRGSQDLRFLRIVIWKSSDFRKLSS